MYHAVFLCVNEGKERTARTSPRERLVAGYGKWYGASVQKNSKATFVLPVVLLDELRQFVRDGMADSLSALVRQSLELRAQQLREEQIEKEFQEAAQDPLFMADLEDSMAAFEALTAEGLDG
jgi:Arc/MetJ-type ribon-helix-helix transcriptional regulator